MQTGMAGRVPVGQEWWPFDRVQAFFDHWLRGEPLITPRVELFGVGGGRLTLRDWPPPSEPVRWYLHSRGDAGVRSDGGALSREPPGEEPPDVYQYDPDDPVRYWLGRDLWGMAASLGDRAALEARPDVLVYSSPTLPAPLSIAGPIRVVLHVASSSPDTDFTAALVDVFPDGYGQLMQEGVVRARYRHSDREEELLRPESPEPVEIDLWAAYYVMPAGHRLRLEVSSSGFGRWDRNLNTGHPLGMDTARRVARNTVYHSRSLQSCVVLPVLQIDSIENPPKSPAAR
jgi:putative CocE/NonD family hydrolase